MLQFKTLDLGTLAVVPINSDAAIRKWKSLPIFSLDESC